MTRVKKVKEDFGDDICYGSLSGSETCNEHECPGKVTIFFRVML